MNLIIQKSLRWLIYLKTLLKNVKKIISILSSIDVNDIKFDHRTSGEVFYFTIIIDCKLFSSQTERLFQKIDEYRKGGYKFNEIIKLTLKINSSLSFINISHHLKLRVPNLHVEFFRKISEEATKLNTLIDRRNPLFYSYQQWVLYNK